MSSLQLGLIALGAVFIIGLVAYNWWQERSIRRDMVRRFDEPIDDVLMGTKAEAASQEPYDADESRTDYEEPPEPEFTDSLDEVEPDLEPQFTDPELDEPVEDEAYIPDEDPDEPFADDVAPEPMAELLAEESLETEPESVPPEVLRDEPVTQAPDEPLAFAPKSAPTQPPGVDAAIDEIAVLTLDEAVSGAVARSHINPLADFGKPVRWLGWSVDAWLPLTRDNETREFTAIAAALQLADRSGPVQSDGLLGFQEQVENLAAQLGGAVLWTEPRDTLRHANTLDQFCIEVDVTVTMHVTAGVEGPFAGTKLRGLAEAHGMQLKEDGRFHMMTEAGETLYTLSNADQRPFTEESLRTATLHDLVLMLDVPRAPKGSETFRQMAMLGGRLETALNARLTDANRRALGDAELDQIRAQVQTLQGKMQERGIIPGSPTALRLFS